MAGVAALTAVPEALASPPPVPSQTLEVAQPLARTSLQDTLAEGWQLASAPRLSPPALPRTPRATRGDTVKHGVNFSRLMENAEFERWDALTKTDVDFFLRKNQSFLADFSEDGRSAAEIIVGAAEKHGVNPWVILATLEKESSVVSSWIQPGRGTLRSAMGYGYDDAGSSPGSRSSFAYQVDKGTELLRKLYDEGQQLGFPQRMKVDYRKRSLTVRNAATYALVRYTPHTTDTRLKQVGGGNYLFRKHFLRFQKDYSREYTRQQAPRLEVKSP